METSTGIVLEKKSSANGKPMVNVDGKWYFAGRCDVTGVNVGNRIEFGWTTFGSDPANPMRGIENWAFTPNQPSPQEVDAAKTAAAPKSRPFGKGGGGFSKEKDRALEIDLQCMRFVGQAIGSLVEKGVITGSAGLKQAAKEAWDAISFTRTLGGTAPAPATTPSSVHNATTPAGSPQQSPQGGASSPTPTSGTGQRVRPTGLFGYGKKFKDTPWNVMDVGGLAFFRDESNAPPDVKKKCDDELWHREEEKRKADQVQQDMNATQATDEWDADIPFAWATLIPLGGMLAYAMQAVFQVWGA